MIPIKQQILQTLDAYAKECMNEGVGEHPLSPVMSQAIELTVKQSMLSGMSLVAHFLAANDGHPNITPHAIEAACIEIGRDLGLVVEKLRKANPNVGNPPG